MSRFFLILLVTVCILAHASLGYTRPAQNFTLGCGDILEVSVWGDEALTKQVTVRPDGFVSFPLVGDIQAAGKTVEELRAAFAEKVKEFVPDAPVTIILQELGSTKVYVVGKVNLPGMYLVTEPITVLQALALAGGITPYAEEGAIKVVRIDSDGTQHYLTFDYDKAVSGDGLEQNVSLLSGDTLLVP